MESKDIDNLKQYIEEEENKKYKISIIYTFTNIDDNVNGLNKEMSFMASEIKSEEHLKNLIEELKIKNENNILNKSNYIYINFSRDYSDKIEFTSHYILNNFKSDKYNYIFIIHIKRSFGEQNKKIFSLLDINPDINQIFIDNLNADNYLKFKYILPYEIQDTLKNRKDELKLNEEFDKILKLFLDDYSEEIDEDTDEYFNEIQNCLDHETRLKDIIM